MIIVILYLLHLLPSTNGLQKIILSFFAAYRKKRDIVITLNQPEGQIWNLKFKMFLH